MFKKRGIAFYLVIAIAATLFIIITILLQFGSEAGKSARLFHIKNIADAIAYSSINSILLFIKSNFYKENFKKELVYVDYKKLYGKTLNVNMNAEVIKPLKEILDEYKAEIEVDIKVLSSFPYLPYPFSNIEGDVFEKQIILRIKVDVLYKGVRAEKSIDLPILIVNTLPPVISKFVFFVINTSDEEFFNRYSSACKKLKIINRDLKLKPFQKEIISRGWIFIGGDKIILNEGKESEKFLYKKMSKPLNIEKKSYITSSGRTFKLAPAFFGAITFDSILGSPNRLISYLFERYRNSKPAVLVLFASSNSLDRSGTFVIGKVFRRYLKPACLLELDMSDKLTGNRIFLPYVNNIALIQSAGLPFNTLNKKILFSKLPHYFRKPEIYKKIMSQVVEEPCLRAIDYYLEDTPFPGFCFTSKKEYEKFLSMAYYLDLNTGENVNLPYFSSLHPVHALHGLNLYEAFKIVDYMCDKATEVIETERASNPFKVFKERYIKNGKVNFSGILWIKGNEEFKFNGKGIEFTKPTTIICDGKIEIRGGVSTQKVPVYFISKQSIEIKDRFLINAGLAALSSGACLIYDSSSKLNIKGSLALWQFSFNSGPFKGGKLEYDTILSPYGDNYLKAYVIKAGEIRYQN